MSLCIVDIHGEIEGDYDIIGKYKEPKTGHWIKIGDRGLGYSEIVICKCSECEFQKEFAGTFDGEYIILDMRRAYKYCPNCGAKMVEPQERSEERQV